jgi:Glycosyl transferase family 2
MDDCVDGLSLILPVPMGATTVVPVIRIWNTALEALEPRRAELAFHDWELVVVDGGMTDEARSSLETALAKFPNVRVVPAPAPTKAAGSLLKTGIAESRHAIVAYASVDHGWAPSDLGKLLARLRVRDEYSGRGVDVVNGHRQGKPYVPTLGAKIRNGLVRIVLGFWPPPPLSQLGGETSQIWRRARMRFALRLGDPASSFKVFRRHLLDRIEVQSVGEFVHVELLAKANFLGALMDEWLLADQGTIAPVEWSQWQKDERRVFHNPRFQRPKELRPVEPVAVAVEPSPPDNVVEQPIPTE